MTLSEPSSRDVYSRRCLLNKKGRRAALALYSLLMLVFTSITFGYVLDLKQEAPSWFIVCPFFLGVGDADFAMYTLWVLEQRRTESRSSGFAFSTSAARLVWSWNYLSRRCWRPAFPDNRNTGGLTSVAFAVGLIPIPCGEETKGESLLGK
jgi:hypothetical protein